MQSRSSTIRTTSTLNRNTAAHHTVSLCSLICEALRIGRVCVRCLFPEKIIPKSLDLMHTLMQDCYDADVSIGESPPVDEVTLVSEEEPLYAELGWNRPGSDTMRVNPAERIKQACDVAFGLRLSPARSCVAVNLVQPP